MSWILACINFDIIDLVISFTTTAHELWTWIHTLYEPISLPPVNGTIQREVARGRNIRDTGGKINLSIFEAASATTVVVATEAYNGSSFKIMEKSVIKEKKEKKEAGKKIGTYEKYFLYTHFSTNLTQIPIQTVSLNPYLY